MTATTDLVTLAEVVRPQGRHGELLCELLTDFPAQFSEAKDLQLTLPSGAARATLIDNFWLPTGRNAGRVVLKLAGVDSISDADLLRGARVQLPREMQMPLEESTFYVADLVGCSLYDGDALLGEVSDVHFPTDSSGKHQLDAAAALFVVTDRNGSELLIPFANEFVQAVELSARTIRMKLPPGLSELNQG